MSQTQPPVPPHSPPPPPAAPPVAPPVMPVQPAPPVKKSGLPTWAWATLGCGCLAILLVVGFTVFIGKKAVDTVKNPEKLVERIIEADPNLEVLESEDGTYTIRNETTGEVMTVDYSQLSEGKLEWEGSEGKGSIGGDESGLTVTNSDGQTTRIGAGQDLDDVPDWVMLYPAAESTQAGMTSTSADKAAGAITIATNDSIDDVITYYTEKLEGAGYEVSKNSLSFGDHRQVILNAQQDAQQHTVAISEQDGKTQIIIQYNGKP